MATKKAATDKAASPVTLPQVRIVGHTARMLMVLDRQKAAGNVRAGTKKDYEEVIAGYRAQWSGLDTAHKKAIKEAAAEANGDALDAKQINAAIAALEG